MLSSCARAARLPKFLHRRATIFWADPLRPAGVGVGIACVALRGEPTAAPAPPWKSVPRAAVQEQTPDGGDVLVALVVVAARGNIGLERAFFLLMATTTTTTTTKAARDWRVL